VIPGVASARAPVCEKIAGHGTCELYIADGTVWWEGGRGRETVLRNTVLRKKLEEDGITKFHSLRTQFKSVLPACLAEECKSKSNLGWVCTGPTKKGVKHSKLAKREARDAKIAGKRDASQMSIDLKTVRIPRIERDFDRWLADSKRVWDQLRFHMAARRRMKRQRRTTVR
jgi:hypothetical protein